MEKSRCFNTIEIVDDYTIKKSSKDKLKIRAEYEWYLNPTNLFMTPNVYSYWEEDDLASYTMEYIHGVSLARGFLHGDISSEYIPQIFNSLHQYCTNDKIFRFKGNKGRIVTEEIPVPVRYDNYTRMLIQSMYSDKTYSRLEQTNIDIDKEFKINNHYTPTIRNIIENCPVYLKDEYIRPIHGDLCFSNILIDTSTQNPPAVITIDPRGLLPDGTITNLGDINYDIAKIAHSVIGRYDQIKADFGFDVKRYSEFEYTYDIGTTTWQKKFISEFNNQFSEFEYYNIMIHLFLSMIPLHSDNPEHQEKMLVNALRLYLEKDK